MFPKKSAKMIDGTEKPQNLQNAQRDATNLAVISLFPTSTIMVLHEKKIIEQKMLITKI